MSKVALIANMLKEMAYSRIAPRIVHLILHVTLECNMRCKHCFVDFDQGKKAWSIGEMEKIAEQLPHLVWLDIGGGEPLMREDLKDIVSLFKFQELAIPTNGWDVENIVERFVDINKAVDGKLHVTLSLDGMEKTHDAIRRKGSFQRTINTYNLLKQSGIHVKFNTVLSDRNADDVVELMKYVRSLDPDYHSILLLRGTPMDMSMHLPTPEKIRMLERDIYQIQESYTYGRSGILQRIHKRYQSYKREIEQRTIREKIQVVPCLAGQSHIVIWSNGDVSPCEMLPVVGNIRETSFEDILASKAYMESVESIKNKKCHCTHDCNMVENILFSPQSYLKLLR